MPRAIHICQFNVTSDLKRKRGERVGYERVKQRVLEAGRYSVFDATSSQKMAGIFTRLERDPELVFTRVGFPWIKVERAKRSNASEG